MELLNGLSLQSVRRTRLLFEDRNSQRLPIGRILADDVVEIPSANVDTGTRFDEFVRGHPAGSAVVVFSRPVYPSERTAVIFFHHFWNGGGFIHLTRVGFAWSVMKTNGWIE
jgi:hypothetical protein